MYEATCDKCGKTFSSDTDLENHQFLEQMREYMQEASKRQSDAMDRIQGDLRMMNFIKIMEMRHCSFDEAIVTFDAGREAIKRYNDSLRKNS